MVEAGWIANGEGDWIEREVETMGDWAMMK